MVYRNNAGRLGSGFISACLETRWLGHLGGFYVPERPCTQKNHFFEKKRAGCSRASPRGAGAAARGLQQHVGIAAYPRDVCALAPACFASHLQALPRGCTPREVLHRPSPFLASAQRGRDQEASAVKLKFSCELNRSPKISLFARKSN